MKVVEENKSSDDLLSLWASNRGVVNANALNDEQREDFEDWMGNVNFILDKDFDWEEIRKDVVLFYERQKEENLTHLSHIWDELSYHFADDIANNYG